jgi:hypothetical protein
MSTKRARRARRTSKKKRPGPFWHAYDAFVQGGADSRRTPRVTFSDHRGVVVTMPADAADRFALELIRKASGARALAELLPEEG